MLSLIKFLKIVLPVATVTSATIATVSLVSFQKIDNKLAKTTEDKVLEDFEKFTEEFKEKKMLYAKDGQGNNVVVKDEQQQKKLLEEFEKSQGKLAQSDKVPQELSEKITNAPNKFSQMTNKGEDTEEVNIPTSGLNDEIDSRVQENQDLALPPKPHQEDLTDDNTLGKTTTKQDETEPRKNNKILNQKVDSSGETKEDVDNKDDGMKAGIDSDKSPIGESTQATVGDSEVTSSESLGEDLSVQKDSVAEVGQANNEGAKAQVNAQHESHEEGIDENNSAPVQGNENGVLNEYGNNPITKEKLQELIKLEESASNMLGSLERLLLS